MNALGINFSHLALGIAYRLIWNLALIWRKNKYLSYVSKEFIDFSGALLTIKRNFEFAYEAGWLLLASIFRLIYYFFE
ncbi:hypothetical protein BIV59_04130 [Bacillus sp. MUM 13]|nr:hypothetical protein BIV59_04130 [Bacillus sp. MUM 13]